MNWFYESAGEQQGPVSDGELNRLLAEGKITENTLVWSQGMADWQPLKVARPTAPPPPPPIPGAGQGEVPLGFVRCTATGKIIPESEAIFIGGKPYSPEARPDMPVTQGLGSAHALESADDGHRDGPGWERRGELGVFRAIGETIHGVLLQPGETFARMKRVGGIGNPLLYLMTVGFAGTAVSVFYQIFFEHLSPGMNRLAALESTATPMSPLTQFIAALIALVFIIPLGSFVQAGILHLCLMLFGGARQGFETTYRVNCYAWGSIAVIYLLPVCGQYVALVWWIVTVIIGLTAAHETTTGRAVGAVLLPVAICCAAVIAMVALIVATLHGSIQG